MPDAKKSVPAVLCAAAVAVLLWVSAVYSQFGPEPGVAATGPSAAIADATAAAARAAYEQNQVTYRGNVDMLVRPGLLADRKQKWVKLWARATSVSASDPIEFFAIPLESGKDYESISVTFAKPSDVHAALEFLGMKGGRPVNFAENQFWPKGERVIMTFEWDQPAPADQPGRPPTAQKVHAEQLIVDSHSGATLPDQGFVFVGSYLLPPQEGGKPAYAADVIDSKAIASDYNNRATVLDIPRQAPQGAVYSSQKLNPAFRFTPGQPVTMMLRPERADGPPRVVDLDLYVSMPAGATGPQSAAYVLKDASGKAMGRRTTLVDLLASFEEVGEAKQDPFVTIHMDDAMTLASVRQVYQVLQVMDVPSGIRIEAAPPGNVYYRAFFPNEDWRDRTKRLGRPWEAHFVYREHQAAATLILPADEIDDNGGQGDLKFAVGSAQEMARVLAEKSGRFSQTVYIFAPGSMPYGALMSFVGPAMKTHPGMFVFLPK